MKKNLITIIVMALMAMTANAQTVVAEIDWTQRSEYLDLWYSDLATVTVKQGTGLIIDCTSDGTGNYWQPQVPMIGHIAKITGGGQYQVKFTVDAPAAGEIRLDLCSWDGTGATHSKIIEVTAGEAEYTIDFEDYPTECTDAMIFYQCGKIPGRHIIKKVQVLDLENKIGQTFKVHGFYYKIGDYYTVSVTSGEDANYYGDLVIPSQVTYNGKTYSVTSIEKIAFHRNSAITSVTIPNSVASIGESTFGACTKLSSITIPNSVTEIGPAAFYGCNSITAVNVPAKVKSIDSSAFEDCNNLTSLTMNEGLESIGGSAFEGCTKLKTLSIPSTVNSIKVNAFKNCTSLNTITSEIQKPFAIDGNVFSIYSTATLIVPVGTKSAYQSTAGWKLFQNIIEPSQIGQKFKIHGIYFKIGKDNTVSVTSGDDANYFGDLVIPSQVTYDGTTYSVTSIEKNVFHRNSTITSVKIPNSVTSIGESSFGACTKLSSVTIPNSVTEIDPAAFYGCTALKEVNLPSGLKRIENNLFWGCTSLTSVTIPEGVTSIAEEAFRECSALPSIDIPNSVTEIGKSAFEKCI